MLERAVQQNAYHRLGRIVIERREEEGREEKRRKEKSNHAISYHII